MKTYLLYFGHGMFKIMDFKEEKSIEDILLSTGAISVSLR